MISIAAVVILLDQLSKWWWQIHQAVTFNQQLAWSVPISLPPLVLTILLSLGVILLAMSWRRFWLERPVITGLFFGAAISNLIDRWWWGAVRDWLKWPVIDVSGNLADLMLTLAVVAIIWRELKSVT